jgi:hypothetical protein
MLTIPTVLIAINPTTNGLYPIDLRSLKFVDKPIAAIAIVRKIFELSLIKSTISDQFFDAVVL